MTRKRLAKELTKFPKTSQQLKVLLSDNFQYYIINLPKKLKHDYLIYQINRCVELSSYPVERCPQCNSFFLVKRKAKEHKSQDKIFCSKNCRLTDEETELNNEKPDCKKIVSSIPSIRKL